MDLRKKIFNYVERINNIGNHSLYDDLLMRIFGRILMEEDKKGKQIEETNIIQIINSLVDEEEKFINGMIEIEYKTGRMCNNEKNYKEQLIAGIKKIKETYLAK